ncbi:MAG: hypothetical protein Q9218_005844 [Villophora microphyllina]
MQAGDYDYYELIQDFNARWTEQSARHFDLAVTIIAAINVAAACAMIAYILFDARTLARSRHVRRLLHVHPAEVFPLVISVAIVVQGTASIAVQSVLSNKSTLNCKVIPQIVWPTLWIVPYTMLVFGLETTFRSLHRKRFQHQRWRNVGFCVIAMIVMVLATWVPSFVDPSMGRCHSSIIGWTTHFVKVGLVIGSCVLFTYIVCATVITAQLLRTSNLDSSQRISATRVVYYLIVSSLIMALVIPFFTRKHIHREAHVPARLAEVALNLLGIINLLLHVFLRSNADRAAIRSPKSMSSKKRPLRVFGPSDLEMTMHITSPVLLEKEVERLYDNDNHKLVGKPRAPSEPTHNTNPPDKELGIASKSPRPSTIAENTAFPDQENNVPPQIIVSPSPFPHRKNSNYSIFPTFRSAMLRNSMSTTFSQDSEEQPLQPPKPILLPPSHHKRDLSQQTSATRKEPGFAEERTVQKIDDEGAAAGSAVGGTIETV